MHAFLRGIPIARGQLACVFTWYSYSWRATCTHFYVVFHFYVYACIAICPAVCMHFERAGAIRLAVCMHFSRAGAIRPQFVCICNVPARFARQFVGIFSVAARFAPQFVCFFSVPARFTAQFVFIFLHAGAIRPVFCMHF